MLDMYGYVMEALHHTPNDVGRLLQVVPGSPASTHNDVDDEHNSEVWELYSGVLTLR